MAGRRTKSKGRKTDKGERMGRRGNEEEFSCLRSMSTLSINTSFTPLLIYLGGSNKAASVAPLDLSGASLLAAGVATSPQKLPVGPIVV
jgi:hypothetical protein